MLKSKFVAIVAALLVLTLSSNVLADGIITDPPSLSKDEVDNGKMIPIKKGWVTPITGVLLSPKAVAVITVKIKSLEEKVQIEVNKAKSLEKAECKRNMAIAENSATADKKICETKINSLQFQNSLLIKEIEKNKTLSSSSSWLLPFGIGVFVGVSLSLFSVFVVNKLTQ